MARFKESEEDEVVRKTTLREAPRSYYALPVDRPAATAIGCWGRLPPSEQWDLEAAKSQRRVWQESKFMWLVGAAPSIFSHRLLQPSGAKSSC